MDYRRKAIDAGKQMAAHILELGHDKAGTERSLSAFLEGMTEVFEDEELPNFEELAAVALMSARAELERRKVH
jgi:hypothetical protein